MAHLSVEKLISKLQEIGIPTQEYVKVYDGNTSNPNALPTGTMVQLYKSDPNATIAPMEAFFIEVTSSSLRELVIPFTPDMMVHGDYTTSEQTAPQTRSAKSNTSAITLANIKAYTENGEGVIAANETIKQVQVVTAAGQVLTTKRPESTSCRVALASGVNFGKVTTENGEQTFKLTR